MKEEQNPFKELDDEYWTAITSAYQDVIKWRAREGKKLNGLTAERWEFIKSIKNAGMRPSALKTFRSKIGNSDMMSFVRIAEKKWGGKDERI